MLPSTPFDVREPFIVEVQSRGLLKAKLKYPSDDFWKKRRDQLRIVQVEQKGATKFLPIRMEDFDFMEFGKIRVAEDGFNDQFDAFEASAAIVALGKAKKIELETLPDNQYAVTLEVYGTENKGEANEHARQVVIILQEPRRRQVVEYQEAISDVTRHDRGRRQVLKISLEPSIRLFKELFVEARGYADGSPIPACHQDEAIGELIDYQTPE